MSAPVSTQQYDALGLYGITEATIPGTLAYGGQPSLDGTYYPGGFTGGVGDMSTVPQQFGAASTSTGSNASAISYGTATAKKPFYDQPIFWALALGAIAFWGLAHLALIESKL
jgi:hypothetical protein